MKIVVEINEEFRIIDGDLSYNIQRIKHRKTGDTWESIKFNRNLIQLNKSMRESIGDLASLRARKKAYKEYDATSLSEIIMNLPKKERQ